MCGNDTKGQYRFDCHAADAAADAPGLRGAGDVVAGDASGAARPRCSSVLVGAAY